MRFKAVLEDDSVSKSNILLSGKNIIDFDGNWLKLIGATDREQIINTSIECYLFRLTPETDECPGSGTFQVISDDVRRRVIIGERCSNPMLGSRGILYTFMVKSESPSAKLEVALAGLRDRELFNSSPDIIFGFDREHRHIYANNRVEELLSIPAGSMIGKTHRELGFEEDYCIYFENCIEATFKAEKEKRFQFSLQDKIFDWYLIPLRNEQGEVYELASFAREVSELKNVKKALEKSQKELKEALKISKLAWWKIDPSQHKIILNNQFRSIIGLSKDDYPFEGMKTEDYLRRFVVKEDQETLNAAFRRIMNAKDPSHRETFEYTLKRHSGVEIKVRTVARLLTDNDGKPKHIYGTIQDITEIWKARKVIENYRKNLEKIVLQKTLALRQSEAKLNDALNLANLGTWEYDFGSRRFKVGERVLEILGYVGSKNSSKELPLERFMSIIHPDDLKHYQEIGRLTLKNKNEDYSEKMLFRIIRPDGEIRKLFISIKILLDDKGWHTMHYGTVQDITEIYNVEKKLDRLSSIIEATPDIVFVFNHVGRVQYMNQAGRNFWGLDSFDERSYFVKDLFSSYEVDSFWDNSEKLDELGYFKTEYTLHNQHGLEVPVNAVIIVHHSEPGEPNHYSVTFTDISQVKKVQEKLVYKNNELDTFLYRASHDLRGPVASMAGLYQLAEMEVDDPKAGRFFGMFNKQISRLNHIISTLAELTIIKERDLVLEEVNLEETVYEVIASLYKEPNYDLTEWSVEAEKDRTVLTDRSLLVLILQSLLENSLRYARPDVTPRVRVQAILQDAHRVVLFVDDNSMGIEKNIQNKVFNMFFRGNEISKGSGLGLYLLRNAVERLGGSVFLSSEAGIGTTFRVEIVVNVQEPEAPMGLPSFITTSP
ncbi:PAS domain S-box protein [Roseivirga sp. BDSF3-8]|uniref:PAS domain S-box protein n=1 Tax=Roseivirga sp. BDSF3-8 TaxID=3241598 RepID=UPI0035323568